ncbi:hypothetical protein [Pseudoroseicyclus tamaricis]|uniref:Acetyltransferase-like isoleucine patch superfamily enzyme n=1 Tax=Pseudoroseicyclus tamaricis TaxID=2705421 RepID=A0A6B2JVC5_9RHOB|nr:hypothetical protein [Pseudoroseicyclus tamaricis]NDV02298.1 hypothetical protein [Pseudoroseicyclus tamaricis]
MKALFGRGLVGPSKQDAAGASNNEVLGLWHQVAARFPDSVSPIPDKHLDAYPLQAGSPMKDITINGRFGRRCWLFVDKRYFPGPTLRIDAVGKKNMSNIFIVLGRAEADGGLNARMSFTVLGGDTMIAMGYLRRFKAHFAVGPKAEVTIGDDTSTHGLTVKAVGSRVSLGRDCMIGGGSELHSTAYHGMVDLSGPEPKRIEASRSIMIGDHVWLGEKSCCIGRVEIGSGAVLGAHGICRGKIEANSVAVGNPAKVVRRQRTWVRADEGIDDATERYLQDQSGGTSHMASAANESITNLKDGAQ